MGDVLTELFFGGTHADQAKGRPDRGWTERLEASLSPRMPPDRYQSWGCWLG